jgi:competence protein ComEC
VLLSLLCIAWLAGIALGSKLNLSFTAFFLSLPLVALSCNRKFRRKSVIAAACVLMLVGGAVLSGASRENVPAGSISTYNGQNVVISGMVASDPDIRDENVRLRVSVLAVDINGASRQSTGDLLVYAARYPSFEYGDILQISGKLNVPVAFDEFDYAGYLARQDIYSVMFYPEIEIVDSGQGNPVLEWIYSIRHRLADSLARVLPEPQASIAQGILLGLRSNISTEVNDTFIQAGTTHLLAISGLNLTLISGLMVSLIVFLIGRRHYLYVWMVAAAIWSYVILCGASPSVVRAAIMSSIFLVSELTGRQKNGGPALLFTAAIMVGINVNLLSDISFQLSFLSMCGLVYVYPVLREFTKRLESRVPERFSNTVGSAVMDSLAISTSAVIAIWPALAINFGAIATAGPLATLIISPTLPVIMVFSFAASVCGIVYPVIGQAIGAVAWLFISFMLLVNRFFALWPTIGIKELNAYIVAGYYSVLLISVHIFTRFKRRSLFA